MFFRGPFKKVIKKRLKLTVVAGAERSERKFLITGAVAKVVCIFGKGAETFFSNGAINKTCLAETAAADASAHKFKLASVVNDIDKRNDETFRIENAVKVLDNAFCNRKSCGFFCNKFFYGAVFIINNID